MRDFDAILGKKVVGDLCILEMICRIKLKADHKQVVAKKREIAPLEFIHLVITMKCWMRNEQNISKHSSTCIIVKKK